MKASGISACLRDIVWRNQYLNTDSKIINTDSKIMIYINTRYETETKPDSTKTLEMMRTLKIKILRSIHGRILQDLRSGAQGIQR